jgi:hypothetical protein
MSKLYLYSPFGPSWPVLGKTLLYFYTSLYCSSVGAGAHNEHTGVRSTNVFSFTWIGAIKVLTEIWESHSGEYEGYGLMACDAVLFDKTGTSVSEEPAVLQLSFQCCLFYDAVNHTFIRHMTEWKTQKGFGRNRLYPKPGIIFAIRLGGGLRKTIKSLTNTDNEPGISRTFCCIPHEVRYTWS